MEDEGLTIWYSVPFALIQLLLRGVLETRDLSPLRWVLTKIADLFLVLTGGTRAPSEAALREAHLLTLIEQGRRSGAVGAMEEEMIQKVCFRWFWGMKAVLLWLKQVLA